MKGRFTKLKILVAAEDIHMQELGLRKLVEKWQKFGTYLTILVLTIITYEIK